MSTFRRPEPESKPFIAGVEGGVDPLSADATSQQVIVIGAGAAGLTAARILSDHGCEVTVLEGRSRTGGRLNTMAVDGGVVDEGGNWIHGGRANPLYHLATNAGLEVTEDTFISPRHLRSFDKVSGRTINPLKVLCFLSRADRVAQRYATESLDASHPEPNLGARLENEVTRIPGAANQRQYRSLMRTMIDMPFAKESQHLHPNAIALNPDYHNEPDCVIAGGYRQLIDRLAAGLDIRLNETVETIRYCNTGVEIVTATAVHSATSVIVTVPIGVLKAQTIVFDPPLPARKLQAIKNVGAGVVEKVILTFDTPFWRRSPDRPSSLFYVSDVLGEFPAFIDSTSSAGRPMLVAFVTGEQVQRCARDSQPLADRAQAVLRDIFPDTYQAPTATRVTDWGTDPFSLCSYSTPTVGVSAADYDQLAEPTAGRVLFAGEATYRERSGFVEGAIGSGIREARRILGRDVDLELKPQHNEQ